jgi:hypothetical protein
MIELSNTALALIFIFNVRNVTGRELLQPLVLVSLVSYSFATLRTFAYSKLAFQGKFPLKEQS